MRIRPRSPAGVNAHSPCAPSGGFLEARKLPGGRVVHRQSADPASPALTLEPNEIRAFVEGAKAGLADGLLP